MSKPRGGNPLLSLLFSPFVKHSGTAAPSATVLPQTQIPMPRPADDDRNTWHAYWQAQGQPWRTEPEISKKRQQELERCRAIVPDIERGIYPFKNMRLSRADVEWLLATHQNGRGPVDWSDESQWSCKGLDLHGADLRHVDLERLPLTAMKSGLTWDDWFQATPEQHDAAAVLLDGAHLGLAHLENARLTGASLKGTDFRNAYLHDTILNHAHLAGASFHFAYLEGTHFEGAILCDKDYGGPHMADVRWGNVNLSVVKWTQLDMLGDEYKARQKMHNGKVKDHATRLEEYEAAVRANRQLSVVLQAQGLNEDASRFSYRAQILQRSILWLQIVEPKVKLKQRTRSLRAWLFSWFLFLIAGYGYKPSRSFLAYFLVIFGFATSYYLLGHTVGPVLSPLGAFVFSMTSFHGRGFFPGNNIALDDPLTVLAAFEALVGLIIEVTFIATLTQRFFNR